MIVAPEPSIRLYILDDVRIETASSRIEPNAEVVFCIALYLLLERGSSVPRRTLEELAWPEANQSVASHRLRQTLLKLKKLGLPLDVSSKGSIAMGGAAVRVDIDELLASQPVLSNADCRLLRNVFRGFNPRLSGPYSEWFESKLSAIISSTTPILLNQIALQRSEGRWADIEVWAGALRSLSPYNEEATLALAESLVMRGAKYEAKQLLDDYLREVGSEAQDLSVEATLLRQRISIRTGSADATTRDSRFVGRTVDLRAMSQLLVEAKSGRGQGVLILGDAGIGKTRLLRELSSFAVLQGFSVQRIQCRPSHAHRPLSAFVELAPVLRGLRGAIGCSPETLTDLDRLSSYRQSSSQGALDSRDSQWAYGRILRALFDIMDAVSEEAPLLIQIEDAHWLDATSSGVLSEMIDWCMDHPVYFALTGRAAPQGWQSEVPRGLRSVSLGPLDDQSSRELLDGIALRGRAPMDSEYVSWCLAVAEGNPYFLQELATYWAETGDKTAVPPSLSAVLSTRVDRLSEDELQVLQVCALLENNSTLPRLEQVLQYEPHRLLQAINGLGSSGMLVVETHDVGVPSDRVSSKHDLLSHVALQRLANPAKVYTHRRIGQVLESEVHSHFSAAVLWDCAKHWRLGGDAQRALSLAVSCAQHLLDMGLSSEAIEAFDRCMPFCVSDTQRLEVLEAEVGVYYRCSDWKRVREVTQLARAVKSRLQPGSHQHDDLELMDLRAQWQSLQWGEIAAKALACLEAIDATPRHRVEGGTMALMLAGFQSDTEKLPKIYKRVCDLVERHSLPKPLRLQADMVFHTEFGDLDEAIAAARELIAEHRTLGNVAELFRAHCNAGVTFRVGGLFNDAEASFQAALELAERYELQASIVRVLPMLANFALERGDVNSVRNLYDRMSALVIDSANEIAVLELGSIGARLALINNDGEKARQLWPLPRSSAIADKVIRRKAYNTALQTAIDLAVTGLPDLATLASLLDACRKSQRGLHQAYNFCIARTALQRVGRGREGDLMFDEYLANRREPWPVPDHLAFTADSLAPSRLKAVPLRMPSVSR